MPRSTAARNTSPRSTCSAGSRSRSPASSGRWTRRSSDGRRRDRRWARRVRIYEVGPRDGLQNEATAIPTATKARFIELLADAGPARDRGDELRRAARRSRSSPTPTSCGRDLVSRPAASAIRSSSRTARAWSAPRPPAPTPWPSSPRRPTRSPTANIGMTVERVAGRLRAGPRGVPADLGWWRRGYVSTAFGCPYTGRSTRDRRWMSRCDCSTSASTRSVSATRSASASRPRSPRSPGWPSGAGSARAHRLPLPRHARHGARQRDCRPGCGGPLLRCLDRRHGRLPVRARRGGQSRHGGPRLLPRRVGLGPGVALDGVLVAARFIADALGRPLASKVGQAGGWDPSTGAPTF